MSDHDNRELYDNELVEAINRLYGDTGIIQSNTPVDKFRETPQTAEERADYLFETGYIDKALVNRESVIKAIKEAVKDEKLEHEKKDADDAKF